MLEEVKYCSMNAKPRVKPKRETSKPIARCLGRYSNGLKGPTLICICSIHGNEPAGLLAFQNILKQLEQMQPTFYGELYGLAGNLKAIKQNVRYIDKDLNRMWGSTRSYMTLSDESEPELHEKHEMLELKRELHKIFAKSMEPIIILDLHTTSSKSTPFISINDTIRNRDFALKFHLPIVLGIEEFLEGTILNYINEIGYVALGFEGGQHEDPASVSIHESAIWTALFQCGAMRHLSDWRSRHLNFLRLNSLYSSKVFDVRHRHAVKKDDDFKMYLGFENFQLVSKEQGLATDRNGEVTAPKTGRIFMPLYQKLGNDGFFIVREIKLFWLVFSKVLRKYNFHQLLYLLPGIHPYNDSRHTIAVNKKIARWKVIDFFHLLGFRRRLEQGNKMIFVKREFDTTSPK